MIFDLRKAGLLKRIPAWILDTILISILAVFGAWALSSLLNYDSYQSTLSAAYEKYASEYGITRELAYTEPSLLTQEQIDQLNAASAAIAADSEAVYAYNMVINLQMLIVTFGLLFAFLVLEFVVPLVLKDGQTVGKRIFGVGLMHAEGIRITHVGLFVRAILGKYAVGTMIPVCCLITIINGTAQPLLLLAAAAVLLVQLGMLVFSRNHLLLHDRMSMTVAVDLASQMIFSTREEMLEYKKKAHAERVAAQSQA